MTLGTGKAQLINFLQVEPADRFKSIERYASIKGHAFVVT